MFDLARRQLAWLLEDGYVEAGAEVRRASFKLDYRSTHGAGLIGVHLGMSEVNVGLGPPGSTWLSGGLVELRTALTTLGFDAPAAYAPNRASRDQLLKFFTDYLEGLKRLRHNELAGDWTRFERAKDDASDAAWRPRMGRDESR